MNDVALRAVGVGKQYRIGQRQQYKALRDTLTDAIFAPFRAMHSFSSTAKRASVTDASLWALKDISFEVNTGEVVGVIGCNGAGKSTLLRIISRITEPSEGYVDLCGRVGSLLEVGTGFHPELTGRENIYLNGSIIGMKKLEIDRKFDEIVDFAEIDQFLDTPVKYYSSGMYMRLAFAVAAHLEPEILLVDEVLAVGDSAFQQKCMGRMNEVRREGRTVLFVSHNMAAIRSLCSKCLVFHRGQLTHVGQPDECIDAYLSKATKHHQGPSIAFPKPSHQPLWMSSASVLCNGNPATMLSMGDSIAVSVEFESQTPVRHPRLGFVMSTSDGVHILNANNRYQISPVYELPVCTGTIQCDLGMVPLAAGSYTITLYLGDQIENTHVVQNALSFEVVERDIWGHGQVPPRNISNLWWPTRFRFITQDVSAQSLRLPLGNS